MADRKLAGAAAVFVLVLAGLPVLRGQETAETAKAAESSEAAEPVDPLAALTEGNRLFRNGQIEAAAEAYSAGYSPQAPHPTLVYNLGAAYHLLGRLPEAILWYRRAGSSEDPWLEENLWLARRGLGSRVLPPGTVVGFMARRAAVLKWLAIGLAVASLAVALAGSRVPVWVVAASLLLGGALYASAAAVEHWGPRPAVLLAECGAGSGELPAGTEAWVRRLADGSFGIEGSGIRCPAEAVGLIFP